MGTTREQLKKEIQNFFPNQKLYMHDYENGSVLLSAEDPEPSIDGIKAFDYYEESDWLMRHEVPELKIPKTYEFGVHKDVVKFLDKKNWIAEWYDAGTVLLRSDD